jgi:hypothetical protein
MSATAINACGCSISSTMGEQSVITSVQPCQKHYYIFSDDKTLKQMASELYTIWRQEREQEPPPDLGVHVIDGAGAVDRVG